MAKEKVRCPFSGGFCRDCSEYRGRHYYLCFAKRYRGHVEGVEEQREERKVSPTNFRFDVPPLPKNPKWLVFKD